MDYRSFSSQGLNDLALVQMFEIIGSLTFDLHLWKYWLEFFAAALLYKPPNAKLNCKVSFIT